MTELQVYDKDGLFHKIVKVSAIMAGRYAVLPKGTGDLNSNNILTGIELPQDKYPLVACLAPGSSLPGTTQSGKGERFLFRLLFLAKSFYTGDQQFKAPDPNTNTSMHTIPMDWNDMKIAAIGFMNSLEKLIPQLMGEFIVEQGREWQITRISEKNVDGVSGVVLSFYGSLATPCTFPDYNMAGFVLPTTEHPEHFH